jgi:vacuolar-type H+-ATPase subunit H
MDEDELLAYIKENDIDLDLTMNQLKKLDADELREAIEDAEKPEEKIPPKRVLKRK